MRNKISSDKLIESFKEQYIDTGILKIPMEVVKLIISSYNESKINELMKGSIIHESFGDTKITVRKTNSTANNGLSAKVVTVLNPDRNSMVCSIANKDPKFLESLKCDA